MAMNIGIVPCLCFVLATHIAMGNEDEDASLIQKLNLNTSIERPPDNRPPLKECGSDYDKEWVGRRRGDQSPEGDCPAGTAPDMRPWQERDRGCCVESSETWTEADVMYGEALVIEASTKQYTGGNFMKSTGTPGNRVAYTEASALLLNESDPTKSLKWIIQSPSGNGSGCVKYGDEVAILVGGGDGLKNGEMLTRDLAGATRRRVAGASRSVQKLTTDKKQLGSECVKFAPVPSGGGWCSAKRAVWKFLDIKLGGSGCIKYGDDLVIQNQAKFHETGQFEFLHRTGGQIYPTDDKTKIHKSWGGNGQDDAKWSVVPLKKNCVVFGHASAQYVPPMHSWPWHIICESGNECEAAGIIDAQSCAAASVVSGKCRNDWIRWGHKTLNFGEKCYCAYKEKKYDDDECDWPACRKAATCDSPSNLWNMHVIDEAECQTMAGWTPTTTTTTPEPKPEPSEPEEPKEPSCIKERCYNKKNGNMKRKLCDRNSCAACPECGEDPAGGKDRTRCEKKCYKKKGGKIKKNMCKKNKCAACAEC